MTQRIKPRLKQGAIPLVFEYSNKTLDSTLDQASCSYTQQCIQQEKELDLNTLSEMPNCRREPINKNNELLNSQNIDKTPNIEVDF